MDIWPYQICTAHDLLHNVQPLFLIAKLYKKFANVILEMYRYALS